MAHKALEILKSFSNKDLNNFTLFITSGYFNSEPRITEFYNIIQKEYPDFKESQINKLLRENFLNTDKKSTVNNLYSDLLSLIIKYLAQSNYELETINEIVYYSAEGEERSIDYLVNKAQKEFYKELYKPGNLRAERLYDLYLITTDIYNLKGKQFSSSSKKKFLEIFKLQGDVSKFLTYYFLICAIKNMENYNWQKLNYNSELCNNFPDIELLDHNSLKILENVHKTDIDPLFKKFIRIYFLMYGIYIPQSNINESLEEINCLLNSISNNLTVGEKHFIYNVLNNYITSASNIDNGLKFSFWDLYLANKAYQLSVNDKMFFNQFRNFITNAFKFRNYKWAEDFKNNYITETDNPEMAENYYSLLDNYTKKDYPRVLQILSTIKLENFIVKVERHMFRIRCYIGLNDYETVKNEVVLFKKFLKNNEQLFSKEKMDQHLIFAEYALNINRMQNEGIDNGSIKNILLKKAGTDTYKISLLHELLE